MNMTIYKNDTYFKAVTRWRRKTMEYEYGVWPCKTHTLEDQLGLAPGTKSKIEDGSTVGTSVTLRTAVADFR
jgi:hypothetical protein